MTPLPTHLNILLFDWDGTLSDTAAAGLEAFQKTFADLGSPVSRETYERIYSPNWYLMYETLALPREVWPKADELWLQHYGHRLPHLVDGAGEVIRELKRRGYRFGVVSSGTCSRVYREIEILGLRESFEAVICNESIRHKKPHPEGLLLAMARMRCQPHSCCYIGDSPEDIRMGRNAGVFTVGVLSGYPTSRYLAAEKPDLCLESIQQLLDHFRGGSAEGTAVSTPAWPGLG
jgi:HAD superfamily hydrolase (TIGR01549 family)